LKVASQRMNVKLRDVAQNVIAAASRGARDDSGV
jgi:hypothetical protein